MKEFKTFTLAICIAALWLAETGARAQSGFTNLHSFNVAATNNAGEPYAGLVLSGTTLYGVAESGGTGGPGAGTVFKVDMDGTGYTNLINFPHSISGNNAPDAGLALSGSELYGVTRNGGTVFEINTNGTGFTNFPSLGENPEGTLIFAGNTLYGTTYSDDGEVFSVNISTMIYSNLYSFSETGGSLGTNSDGSAPGGGLVLSSGTLYGTATTGGTGGHGTVFKVDADGSNFMTLHSFTLGAYDPALEVNTNSDGVNPYGTLVLSGGTLYGTTSSGGPANNGTVFSISTAGTNFTVLHTFSAVSESTAPAFESFTNADGANPHGGLILSGSTLYGTAYNGGDFGSGTVFEISTNGSGFTTLYNFSGTTSGSDANSDGSNPYGGLLLSGGTLYGTAVGGGPEGYGTVFAVSLFPALITLNVQLTGNSVVLSWNNPSFFLQGASSVSGPYANITSGYSPYTNAITGTQHFFRLQAN